MTRIVREVRGDVAERLGTDAGAVRVRVRTPPLPGTRASAERFEGGANLYFDPSLEGLPYAAWVAHAVHELTHAHVRGHWETLPHELEEGLCDLVTLELVPQAEPGMLADIGAARRQGLERVRTIGFDVLQDLCRRAAEGGLAEIPEDWL